MCCRRCGAGLAIHEGHPQITLDGRIDIWCRPCWPLRDRPLAIASYDTSLVAGQLDVADVRNAPRRTPSRRRGRALALGGVALVGLVGFAASGELQTPLAGTWQGSVAAAVAPPPPSTETAVALAPLVPSSELEVFDPDRGADDEDVRNPDDPARPALDVPVVDGEPLDERYPTLRDWAHPVTGTDEKVPVRSTRCFGAHRDGVDREECGSGHCGVDLAGPRGQPLVAVAWGTVVRVEHSWMGRDGRSGRYVRIEHPDGVYTSYMHMDDIAPGLEVGDEVEPGQMVGWLGKSGIVRGEHHLHFALEVPGRDKDRPQFIDPAPFLHRARVVPAPDRRPPRNPQW